jgi:hypothetical protein
MFNVPEQLQQSSNLLHVEKSFQFCLRMFNVRTKSYATNV